MRLIRFRVQGFKNIADASVDNLAEINVFFGLNDVGKSNLFQAVELWQRLLSTSQSPSFKQPTSDFERRFGTNLSQLGGSREIAVTVDVALDQTDLTREGIEQRVSDNLDTRLKYLGKSTTQFTSKVEVEFKGTEVSIQSHTQWEGGGNFGLHPKDLASIVAPFHVISAERRLQTEERSREAFSASITHGNLKQALFYAYLSSDIRQKRRFAAITSLLSEPPFSLGELDVALDPLNDQIDIGFIRSKGRLPIENLGAGARQLLLVLGQVFLNEFPVIALEEPEMNLSPQRQQELMIALRKLMRDPAVRLNQLFISTHSPYFEFTENFYDVALDELGNTQVREALPQDHTGHFAVIPSGPDNGARLNSLNQVKLYNGVIEDLNLRRGDLIVFVRNDEGRWEIRTAGEVAQELQISTSSKLAA